MKTVINKKQKADKSWTLPGVKLTHEEFVAGIHKAEEGPFYTVQESMEHFELWTKSRQKK